MNASAPDQYAVFGNPIAHSRSPLLHAEFARLCGQPVVYRAILAPLDGFGAALQAFIAAGGRGANVTVPFKLEAFALCDQLSARAAEAGAVNTVWYDNGSLYGDNTDGLGLVTDITANAKFSLAGRRILLLGAGGAARGALGPLLDCKPAALVIANRSTDKAQQLAAGFMARGVELSASSFADLSGHFDLVVNATSASLANDRPALPDGLYGPGSLAYDMMYGSAPSPFLQQAAGLGASIRDGWGMLVEQAAEAFYLWRGVRPATAGLLDREQFLSRVAS